VGGKGGLLVFCALFRGLFDVGGKGGLLVFCALFRGLFNVGDFAVADIGASFLLARSALEDAALAAF